MRNKKKGKEVDGKTVKFGPNYISVKKYNKITTKKPKIRGIIIENSLILLAIVLIAVFFTQMA